MMARFFGLHLGGIFVVVAAHMLMNCSSQLHATGICWQQLVPMVQGYSEGVRDGCKARQGQSHGLQVYSYRQRQRHGEMFFILIHNSLSHHGLFTVFTVQNKCGCDPCGFDFYCFVEVRARFFVASNHSSAAYPLSGEG